MKSYVISLNNAIDRRQHICNELDGLDFDFFDAVTPDQAEQIANVIGFSFVACLNLSPAEKACFASHVCLWQKMLDENLPFMAIFEDDIYLGDDAKELLNHDDWVSDLIYQQSCDVIKLETFMDKVHLGQGIKLAITYRQLHRLKSRHSGSGGYVLSNKVARLLIDLIKHAGNEGYAPIDHFLFDQYLRKLTIYQINPALCIQSQWLEDKVGFASVIEDSRQDYGRQKSKTTFQQAVRRVIKKWYRSVGKRTFFKIIDYK